MHQTRIRRAYYRIFRVANTPDLGDRPQDAVAVFNAARARNVDDTVLHQFRYIAAFLRNRSRGFGFGSEKIVTFRLKYLKWG